jgi:hypothetical protein
MKISLSIENIEKLDSIFYRHFSSDYFNYSVRRLIKDEDADKTQTFPFDLSVLDLEKCKDFKVKLEELKVHKKTITTVDNWIKAISNPSDVVITSLNFLEKTIVNSLKTMKKTYLYYKNPDECLVRYAVSRVKYSVTRDDGAFVSLSLAALNYNVPNGYYHDNNDKIEIGKIETIIHFQKSDISKISESDIDFLLDDENKKDDSSTAKNFFFSKILFNKKLYLPTDELDEEYEASLKKAYDLRKKVGLVFTTNSIGRLISDPPRGSSNWRVINNDNLKSRLVVDVTPEQKVSSTISSENFGNVELPEHPYCLFYDLANFRYVLLHIENCLPYVYDKTIIDKLVLNTKTKEILKSLIGSKNNFEDIISGKSGGIVILSSGGAGLGKTLTAEVYSELMEKPLYSVQSAQLGIDIKEIEKNLNKVLNRAEKWGAVLLIDEADTYVYERGKDILQNAIVGTFLRLMEYYNGILFLTTNRPDIVDDAIMSRVTLHIPYNLPNKEESSLLWSILTDNFSIKISEETKSDIWEKYQPMSGRDIRNFLKDVKKIYKDSNEVKISMLEDLSNFLPFLKAKSN